MSAAGGMSAVSGGISVARWMSGVSVGGGISVAESVSKEYRY